MARGSLSALVTTKVEDLLRFFDEKPDWADKHATSIVGIVGEDLNAACFQHYLKTKGADANVLRYPSSNKPLSVTTGKRKGPRLDRWIEVYWGDGSKTVFQTEIKNWSAHAIGGETLSVCATSEKVTDYKEKRWEGPSGHWYTPNHTLREAYTAKVLLRMKPPHSVDKKSIRPLLIFWEAIGPRSQADNHLFSINAPTLEFPFPLPDTWPNPSESAEMWGFPELWVFSVSSYLRSIQDARVDTIELDMPDAVARLRILNRLFSNGTSEVDEAAARAFAEASPDERKKLQLLLSLRLQELTSGSGKSLQTVMDEIGTAAEARGLTPEILETLLRDE